MGRFRRLLVSAAVAAGVAAQQPALHAQPAAGAPAPAANPNCCDASTGNCGSPNYDGFRVALIFGVNNYGGDSGEIKSLVNAGNDAELMAGTLSPFYKVRCLINVDRDTIYREIDFFRKHIGTVAEQHKTDFIDGRALLYFSGHGFAIDGDNYILAAGSASTKDDAVNNQAILISTISLKMGSYVNFRIYLVFDSCRNSIGGQVSKPAWAQTGFTLPQEFGGQTIVFSTGVQSVAHDEIDETHHKGNGAYMFVLGQYAIFKGLTSGQLLAQSLGEDSQMRSLNQIPISLPGEAGDPMPWVGDQEDPGDCSNTEATVVTRLGFCRFAGNPTECMKQTHVCNDLKVMANSGSAACSIKNIQDRFGNEISGCPDLNTPASLVSLLNVVPVPGVQNAPQPNAATTAAQLRFQAGQKKAASRWVPALSEQLNQVSNIPILPGHKTTTQSQTKNIQNQIRAIAASADVRPTQPTGPVVASVPPEGLELSLVPSPTSATTGPVTPTGPVKVDCAAAPCTENWVMAAAPTAQGIIKGWVRADKVVPDTGKCAIPLKYDGERSIPQIIGLKALRSLSSSGCVDANSVFNIIAVIPPTQENNSLDVLRAKERVEFVRRSLLGHVSDPSKVLTTFVQVGTVGPAAPVTVEVLER